MKRAKLLATFFRTIFISMRRVLILTNGCTSNLKFYDKKPAERHYEPSSKTFRAADV